MKYLNGDVVNEKGEAKVYYDWYLLMHNPQTYFKAFERTVLDNGGVLRFEIINELALPENERFSFDRLLLFLFDQMREEHGVPFDIASVDDVPDRPGQEAPIGLRQAIRALADNVGYRGMERLVWEHHMEVGIK